MAVLYSESPLVETEISSSSESSLVGTELSSSSESSLVETEISSSSELSLVETKLPSFPVSMAVSCSLLNTGGDKSSNNYTIS